MRQFVCHVCAWRPKRTHPNRQNDMKHIKVLLWPDTKAGSIRRKTELILGGGIMVVRPVFVRDHALLTCGRKQVNILFCIQQSSVMKMEMWQKHFHRMTHQQLTLISDGWKNTG